MQLLITGGNSAFARAVAAALAPQHTIRLFDRHFTAPLPPTVHQ